MKTPPLSVPNWIQQHLFLNKGFSDLTPAEVENLRTRLSKFKHASPDVSVVIPAWNEENNIYRTLSTLAANTTSLKVEIIVINNNSTDSTQQVLDTLGVTSYFEPMQGITYARQTGLYKAQGKYLLCADADTFYPPDWIELMTAPMIKSAGITGVYGRYAFLPAEGADRKGLWVYEMIGNILIAIRKRHREFINVLGFNMGLVTEIGRETGGFKTHTARTFNNAENVEESEDGRMAIRLKTRGNLKQVTDPRAIVFTSTRKLLQDGSIIQAFFNRLKLHTKYMTEYITGPAINVQD
ncbi:glycosyltransferase family 2 protein [Hymenobacter wooponensis]|uniref:Glycosyltransferase family 2 protein n=1 Tax=Hymenobacter wooponensis TaxID=1525360 RepID=A0A4Z0MNP4_9BACT|nr:glycosyltransferase family A protein [Hymenobacter wooponensis]TGD81164.1 glycosyltransferase family 2 protein [Hymenobacter wooponensis]